jgi:hypothetical protein
MRALTEPRRVASCVAIVGVTALTLSSCSSSSHPTAPPTTIAAIAAATASAAAASSAVGSRASSGRSSSASGPTGKIDLCSEFPAASLSSASGKSFGQTLKTYSDGVYGCAYQSSNESWDWIVAVREPSGGDTPTTDGRDLGGPAAVKPVNGTGYPTIAAKAGVELQFGKDVVEVYTPSSANDAQATTAQFVAVAKAVITAVSK